MSNELGNKQNFFGGSTQGGAARQHLGPPLVLYGLPCANCRAYYPAELTACPVCRCAERVLPTAALVRGIAL